MCLCLVKCNTKIIFDFHNQTVMFGIQVMSKKLMMCNSYNNVIIVVDFHNQTANMSRDEIRADMMSKKLVLVCNS